MPHFSQQKAPIFRHPNVMSEAERLALPDPCRPIDTPVMPARSPDLGVAELASVSDPFHQADTERVLPSSQPFDINAFIHEQQQHSQRQACGFRLPLSQLPTLLKHTPLAWWQQMMTDHPAMRLASEAPDPLDRLSQLETRLYLMGQMYHTMLCVFLLCQCKARKTLNPQITLQDLANAINAYAKAHATELTFLTQQADSHIEPKQVEFALTAMGWQMSKHADIAKRTTTISSQNPLTGC